MQEFVNDEKRPIKCANQGNSYWKQYEIPCALSSSPSFFSRINVSHILVIILAAHRHDIRMADIHDLDEVMMIPSCSQPSRLRKQRPH